MVWERNDSIRDKTLSPIVEGHDFNHSKGVGWLHQRSRFLARIAGDLSSKETSLVGGWVSTHLKNIRKSNWIISPNIRGENSKDIWETTT